MNNQSRNPGGRQMTPMQKKAAIVLACCALAVLVTLVAVTKIVSGAGHSNELDDPGAIQNNEFQLDLEGNDAVLKKTRDAGSKYLKDTVFVGDSNTVRMHKNGLITLDQFVGKEGMGIRGVTGEACVYFEDDEQAYTIPQALAMMKPRRVIVMLGTNDAGGTQSTDEFISSYKASLHAIENAYPYTDIIVSAIPPVPYDHSKYPDITMQTIDGMNQALADMCRDEGYSFLNTTEVLKGENGYGQDNYFNQGDIHLTSEGLNKILDYVRTHALDSKDRRPDTRGIPARADISIGTSSNELEGETFTAKYYVERGNGGTLSSGEQSGQTELSFDVTVEDSITVTAVPADGYTFVRWSDGKTESTRTDKHLNGNLSVTAQFKAKPGIVLSESSLTIKEGEDHSLTATVTGDGRIGKVEWFVDGSKKGTGDSLNLKDLKAGTHKIKAAVKVDGKNYEAEATVNVEALAKGPENVTLNGAEVEWNAGSVTLNAVLTPGDAVTSFEWSGNCAIQANGASAVVTFGPNESEQDQHYQVTVKTSNGLTATATVTVKGKPAEPKPQPEAPDSTVEPQEPSDPGSQPETNLESNDAAATARG